jgi:hypothetical protein
MKGSAAFLGVKNLSPQLLYAIRRAYEAQQSEGESDAEAASADERNADA